LLNRVFGSPKLIDNTVGLPRPPVLTGASMSMSIDGSNSSVRVSGSFTVSTLAFARIEFYVSSVPAYPTGGVPQEMRFLSVGDGENRVSIDALFSNYNIHADWYIFATVTHIAVFSKTLPGGGAQFTPDSDYSTSVFSIPKPVSWPRVAGDTLAPSINEGGTATLTGRIVGTLPGDVVGLRVNWGDGGPLQTFRPGTAPFAVKHRYLDDATYTVTFTAFDIHGGANSGTRKVVVHNVAPALADVVLRDAGASGVAELTGRVADPGLRDKLTLVVTWGDGTRSRLALGADCRFHLTHRYRQAGAFTVKPTITDDDGGSATATLSAHGPVSTPGNLRRVR
jgi:PKD domain